MKVMAFDLSSVCIGVTTVSLDKEKISNIKTAPIIPRRITPDELGFLKSRKKLKTKNGELLNSYAYSGEDSISFAEKKRRDVLVRTETNKKVLFEISKSLNGLINAIKPDIILAENNEIFRGVLTSVLLGKVMGILIGTSAANGIEVEEHKVQAVRSVLNQNMLYNNLKQKLTTEEIMQLPDVTKRAINVYLSELYNVHTLTDDESDSLAVFHYWYTQKYLKGAKYGRSY
jgi:hypothetical protein